MTTRLTAILAITLTAALAFTAPLEAAAKDATPSGPTFYPDVLGVLQQNCQTCHRPAGLNLGGMIAPMALTTYAETRPWAKAIARTVEKREMPPWHASAEYNGVFANERTLTDTEIATLVDWARSGAPMGNEAEGPAPIEWPSTEWAIGEPHLILSLKEPYHVNDDLLDLNIVLEAQTVPAGVLDEDKYIVAAEYKPHTTAVHHIIGFAVTPPSEEGGRPGFLRLPGIAPGAEPSEFPPGFGIRLPKGSQIRLQMHYHKEPGPDTETWDQSTVAFKFANEPVQPMYVSAIGDPRKMYLPANTKDLFLAEEETLEKGITIMSLLPHMHYRGDYSRYVATLPDGTVQQFLEVPNYDFNWQTRYRFKEHLQLPAGTKIEVTMGYDNTADNANNPDPTVDVKWGDRTNDEMNLGFFYWAYTSPQDAPDGGGRANPFVGRGSRGRRQ
ncbi:MAG: hypothetical protein VYE73_01385 [Acidobacteriota bacterium]|nr:hypothetical protein [Acidobacteriota bacterium]